MRITTELLRERKACSEGIAAFEAAYPRGVTYSKPWHKRMLLGPLKEFEDWAVQVGVIEPLVDSAGDHGTAIAGEDGTATAGYYGTATAGDNGTATAGYYGTLRIQYFKNNRYRWAIAYVGEDGILPDVAYRLDDEGSFVRK